MTFATNLLSSSRRLLQAYGQNISFSRVTEGAFIPQNGAVGPATTSSFTAYGAPFNFNRSEIDNDTILATDLQMWVEVNTSGSIPAIGDVATFGGTSYRILNVDTFLAQGTTVVYRLQLRI